VRDALEAGQTLDHQPRSRLPQKKKRRDHLIRLAAAHPTWVLGVADEVWWSRLAQPAQHCWGEAEAVTRLQALTRAKSDPDPKALACDGLLVRCLLPQAEQMRLRFVAGRPISAVTTDLLAWCCDRLAGQGITALLLIWDHASSHTSQAVRSWIRTRNQRVNTSQRGVRFVAYSLPVKSPWLNPIEPKWVHGKRAVSSPDRLLSAAELEARVCAYYACTAEAHVLMPQKVA
jgi:hypothetical protein